MAPTSVRVVLELIEGKNLRLALHDGLDWSARLKVAEQIADVLVVTHAAGIVHRDLKPGNVMIAEISARQPSTTGCGVKWRLRMRQPIRATLTGVAMRLRRSRVSPACFV